MTQKGCSSPFRRARRTAAVAAAAPLRGLHPHHRRRRTEAGREVKTRQNCAKGSESSYRDQKHKRPEKKSDLLRACSCFVPSWSPSQCAPTGAAPATAPGACSAFLMCYSYRPEMLHRRQTLVTAASPSRTVLPQCFPKCSPAIGSRICLRRARCRRIFPPVGPPRHGVHLRTTRAKKMQQFSGARPCRSCRSTTRPGSGIEPASEARRARLRVELIGSDSAPTIRRMML